MRASQAIEFLNTIKMPSQNQISVRYCNISVDEDLKRLRRIHLKEMNTPVFLSKRRRLKNECSRSKSKNKTRRRQNIRNFKELTRGTQTKLFED
jgi:hypothetical protein